MSDYIHYCLRCVSDVQTVHLPWSSNQFMAKTLKQKFKNLYNTNVKKVAVMGLDPIGYAPYYLWLYRRKDGQYAETTNDLILDFILAVRFMAADLNEELVGGIVLFYDAFNGQMDIIQNHDRYGFFNVTGEACCEIQRLDRVDNWESSLVKPL